MFNLKLSPENALALLLIVRFNGLIGFYNLFIYITQAHTLSLIIGAVNIAVWLFTRQEILAYVKQIKSNYK